MKMLRNHSWLKEQENSPKGANNESDLCGLTDPKFKNETVKILKELRADMSSNADSFRKNWKLHINTLANRRHHTIRTVFN